MKRTCALVFISALLGTVPMIAVVSHKHTAPTVPEFFQPARNPDALALYDQAGNQIAYCESHEGHLGKCEIEDTYTLDDVMNAWLKAYEDK